MRPPLPSNIKRLLAARAARSLGQGATVASFTLYLQALGFGGAAIGTVLMAGLLFGALLTSIIGPLSDRVSRRALLIGYEIAAALAALIVLPAALGAGFHSLASYRALFALPLAGSLAALILIAGTRIAKDTPPALAGAAHAPEAHVTRAENRLLRRLAAVSAINGLAIGIVSPLIAYWFLRRYNASPAAIGPALAVGFVLASAGSVLGGHLSRRLGTVRSVVWMRLVALALLVAVPFSPTFLVAAGLYALRSAFNRGTAGARQVVAAGLTRAERRGLAASVQSLSTQLPRAAGPVLGGWLIHRGQFVAPFLLTAAMQALYLFLYRYFFAGTAAESA